MLTAGAAIAQQALVAVGTSFDCTLWNGDTTRRVQRNFHDEQHQRLLQIDQNGELGFRFLHAPRDGRGKFTPSEALPRDISRADEIILLRRRCGTAPESIGGFLHGAQENNDDEASAYAKRLQKDRMCALCRQPDALGRGGRSVTHGTECALSRMSPPPSFDFRELWSNPKRSIQVMRAIDHVYETARTTDDKERRKMRRRRGFAAAAHQQHRPAQGASRPL